MQNLKKGNEKRKKGNQREENERNLEKDNKKAWPDTLSSQDNPQKRQMVEETTAEWSQVRCLACALLAEQQH